MNTWEFSGNNGTFRLEDAGAIHGLYAPVANESGYMGSITPTGGGDATVDQNHFLMPPVSVLDLHNTRLARTAWICDSDSIPWSVTGGSHHQKAQRGSEQQDVEVGLLWHTTRRRSADHVWETEMTTFSPNGSETVEVSRIRIRNVSTAPRTVAVVAVTPLYGRSADAIRDHRHVTSLLNRVSVTAAGVLLQPSMSFDERGHSLNSVVYGVLGQDGSGAGPVGCYPALDLFIGAAGDAERPQAVFDESYGHNALRAAGSQIDGSEAVGALRFPETVVAAGETYEVYLVSGVFSSSSAARASSDAFCSAERFEAALAENRQTWEAKTAPVLVSTNDQQFDQWMRWVSLQPILRRLYGNSFMPYHDYGRGGRGWRDLWQDCLALMLMEPPQVRDLLHSSFAGVRFDGTNATIVGSEPGAFRADRNSIPRVWMDHGAWPVLTVRLYIDQSGDLEFLSDQQDYFADTLWARATQRVAERSTTALTTQDGARYRGSLFEHMLLQQLSAFFNVGDHNTLLLEGADWNDGFDMAREKGESVAFTALYAANFNWLAEVAERLPADAPALEIAEELMLLCDRMNGDSVDYDLPAEKRARLTAYFEVAQGGPSGATRRVSGEALATDLRAKAEHLLSNIRTNEWLGGDGDGNGDGEPGWFNGYYDNTGSRVEGTAPSGPRMTLTGQVFALMSGAATEYQVDAVIASADRFLLDESVGGYRLNTDFQEVNLNLGRCFGFAYGHKENGAMFSHMAVMYAYALYTRGRSAAAWRVLQMMYSAAADFDRSRMYPGLPEYFDPDGRGLYPYLTGSASWYLLTLVTQSFGVRGRWGDLVLAPQLVAEQWHGEDAVGISTFFRGAQIHVEYSNPEQYDAGEYQVESVTINGATVAWEVDGHGAIVHAADLPGAGTVNVLLGRRAFK